MEPLVRFQNIYKSFGKNVLYQNLSLDILRGETLTILGGSGTGKSVLLKILLGLVRADSGEVVFDNQEVGKMRHKELSKMRKRIGMLFQSAALFDSLNVYENIAYPVYEHFRYPREKIDEIVRDKLELVGLPGIETKMPADLSGGMRKRVGLARAIATEPELILYDEPTTGLDPTNTNRIDELILSLQKKLKVTSIVVTHDMNSAFKVSDRLALIYNRKIEFVGTTQQARESSNEVVRNFIKGEIGE